MTHILNKLAMAVSNTGNMVRQVMKMMTKGPGFDRVLDKVKMLDVGDGKCVCEMQVEEEHGNRGNALHGGMTATLVDIVSTCALMTSKKPVPGVSVDMNISYMKAAKIGETIIIEADTLKIGRSLAFLTIDIKRKEDGELVAQGKHTKFIGDN